MKMPNLIVFDMDGVLINVSGSYRETVRRTARLFFEGATGFERLPDPLFPLSDLADLKQTGGLNNDWDLAAQTLHLLFSLVKAPPLGLSSPPPGDPVETIRRIDLTDLAAFLTSSARPLLELLERYGRRRDPFVAACYQGDVNTGNRIKRIFQEIYLGPSLFAQLHGSEPLFYRGEGLIHRETPLIEGTLLASLAGDHLLAIATGRPRSEADLPLDRFNLRQYFRTIITLDDCTEEEERLFRKSGMRVSLKKPDPYMLDRIPRLIGVGFGKCFYLGDMPDDMQAARASKTGYRGVGVVLSSADRENLRRELLRAGAAAIIDNYSELQRIVG